jgi:hypothetical protein
VKKPSPMFFFAPPTVLFARLMVFLAQRMGFAAG